MQDSPVNRLERHWPKKSLPEAEQYDEASAWSANAASWEDSVKDFMADHPKLTLAAAASLGLVLGWMVKRR